MSEMNSKDDLLRVVKVGGSLFADARLPQRFANWLKDQPPACSLILTGGGRLADEIRDLDQRFGLPANVSHELAVHSMKAQATVLRAKLTEAGCNSQWLDDLAGDVPAAGIWFIDPVEFMAQDAQSASPLPASWEVTSDSIAARVAMAASAPELVLLKAINPPPNKNLTSLTAAGYIDPMFEVEVAPWMDAGGRLTFATVSQYK